MVGILCCAACTPKPPPVVNDGRACYLGAVPPAHVESVKVWAPFAQAGDLLMSPSCDAETTELILNDIRRNAR